jgi:ABC-type Fe3+-hydroxamate transport system substrate-binding protein
VTPRVVSLVPSATETLLALGVTPVACTRFCEQPGLPHVGGTKDPNVAEIALLKPDLVVVNDEENRFEDVDRLRRLGLQVHEVSPRSVAQVGPAVVALARAVGASPPEAFTEWAAWMGQQRHLGGGEPRRAFVPVWRRPWMTLAGDTYGSSLLHLFGYRNVFSGHGTRYPMVTLEEVVARKPQVVLLPSEPYPFGERHVPEVEKAMPGIPIMLVDGRDVFWWGVRTPEAVNRLATVLSRP